MIDTILSWVPIVASIAVGLVAFLKVITVAIPGDRDDKILGPVIGVLDKVAGWVAPKTK